MEEALFDDEAASDDLLADMLAEAVDGAVGFPGDVREKFERMAADGVAEEFFFPAEALEAIGFGDGSGN